MNFDALTRYLDSLPGKGVPGCDLIVCRDHEIVYRHMSGERAPGVPMRGDEYYWFYSCTKVYTMTAVMQQVERGNLRLSDPVSKYLPAFADLKVRDGDTVRPARTVLTLEHLMAMQGGLNYNLETPAILACLEKYGQETDTLRLVNAIAEAPLDFDPGTRFQYSLCHDVAAAVVEVVTGVRFADYVRENILKPLGIETLDFHPAPELIERFATRYRWDAQEQPIAESCPSVTYVPTPNYDSGGAGMYGQAESYLPLADALACGGVGRTGNRVLTQESIDEMRRDRLHGQARTDFDTNISRPGYGYALGVRTRIDDSFGRGPVGEFGWDGAAGAYVLIDPANHVSAFYAQHVLGCGRAYHEFHPAMRDLIYEGLEL